MQHDPIVDLEQSCRACRIPSSDARATHPLLNFAKNFRPKGPTASINGIPLESRRRYILLLLCVYVYISAANDLRPSQKHSTQQGNLMTFIVRVAHAEPRNAFFASKHPFKHYKGAAGVAWGKKHDQPQPRLQTPTKIPDFSKRAKRCLFAFFTSSVPLPQQRALSRDNSNGCAEVLPNRSSRLR